MTFKDQFYYGRHPWAGADVLATQYLSQHVESSMPVTLALCAFTDPNASAVSRPSSDENFRLLTQVLRQNLVQLSGAGCPPILYSAGPRYLYLYFCVSSLPHLFFFLTVVEDPDCRMWNISKYQCLVTSDWVGMWGGWRGGSELVAVTKRGAGLNAAWYWTQTPREKQPDCNELDLHCTAHCRTRLSPTLSKASP